MSSSWADKIPSYLQSTIAIGSLIFGVGMLYGDVQDIKKQVSQNGDLNTQTQVLKTELANTQKSQEATLKVLEKLSDNVERLSTSVTRLESQINKR